MGALNKTGKINEDDIISSKAEIKIDDIWNHKAADDFLHYLKFEAINYGYLGGNLMMIFMVLLKS